MKGRRSLGEWLAADYPDAFVFIYLPVVVFGSILALIIAAAVVGSHLFR